TRRPLGARAGPPLRGPVLIKTKERQRNPPADILVENILCRAWTAIAVAPVASATPISVPLDTLLVLQLPSIQSSPLLLSDAQCKMTGLLATPVSFMKSLSALVPAVV